MRTMRILTYFISGVSLAVSCYGQSRPPVAPASPVLPVQQRQFCAAYQEDTARRNAYDAELAAAKAKAGGNPIAEQQIHIPLPDFESLFRARQASLMGNGSFQNWIAQVKVDLTNEKIFLTFTFPCKWTEYGYRPNMTGATDAGRNSSSGQLTFGTSFPPRTGLPLNSEIGNSLATVHQGETVNVSGRFFCTQPPSQSVLPPMGGCTRNEDGMLWVTVDSMHSIRSNMTWKFPDMRHPAATFSVSDDYATLTQKARESGASALGEYLNSISPLASMVNRVPPPGRAFGGQPIYLRVAGDLPSLLGQPLLQKPTPFPDKNEDCFIVKPEDQAALEGRTKEIDRILTSLFDTGLTRVAVSPQPNACLNPDGGLKSSVDPSKIYSVGPGVTTPVLISKVDPEYTQEAKAAKLSGSVRLSVIVDQDGMPQDIQVVDGLGSSGTPQVRQLGRGLDQKAIEAVRKWRWRPAIRNGQPVSVRANVVVSFRLL